MKPYLILLLLLSFLPGIIFAQDFNTEDAKFNFYIGIQTRVTPIYLKHVPDFITVQDRNIWEEPDKHLSGPSLIYKIGKQISSSYNVGFSHAIRQDFLYQTFTFNNQPIQGFRQETNRAIINDFYLQVNRIISLSSSKIELGFGLAICGIGSGYILTQRFVDNNNQSLYVSSKENFQFTAATFNINWQNDKLNAGLRMGYCWRNPTLFKTPFLFPELGIQYQLFSF